MYANSLNNHIGNIWLVPLDHGQSRQLTNFTSDGILSYSFSYDAKQLVYRRGTESRDVVLIKDLR
jgi:hypothetical protein